MILHARSSARLCRCSAAAARSSSSISMSRSASGRLLRGESGPSEYMREESPSSTRRERCGGAVGGGGGMSVAAVTVLWNGTFGMAGSFPFRGENPVMIIFRAS